MVSQDCRKVKVIGAAGVVLSSLLGTVYMSGKRNERLNKYDAEGFDKEDFDKRRFSEDRFDREEKNQCLHDSAGFHKEWHNHRGYDSKGYSCGGFDSEGYNRKGTDWQGYFRNGYNPSGVDRANCDRQYYATVIRKLRFRLDESYQQLQQGRLRYAVYDAGMVLEEILRLIVQHTNGEADGEDSIFENMKICERRGLLGDDRDFMTRLHEVRFICHLNGHEFTAEERMNQGKVRFVIMQIKDLLNMAEDLLL